MSRKWEKVEDVTVAVRTFISVHKLPTLLPYVIPGAHEWILPVYCAFRLSLEIHFTLNDFCLFMFVSMREM